MAPILMPLPYPTSVEVPPPAGVFSDRWRVNVSSKRSTSGVVGGQELEMRGSIGGADLCTGGTASASSDNGTNLPAHMFDDNTGTSWFASGTSVPQWIEYDFPSDVTIEQIAWDPSNANDIPIGFTLEYWDVDLSSWVTYWRLADGLGIYPNSATALRLYAGDDPDNGKYSVWRLFISEVSSSGFWCEANEVEWRTTSGGADQTAPASGNGGDPLAGQGQTAVDNLYDNNAVGVRWIAGAQVPSWFGYRFHEPVNIQEVWISPHSPEGAPRKFMVQYYDHDASQWQTAWEVVDSGVWSAGVAKTFTRPSPPTTGVAKRYWGVRCWDVQDAWKSFQTFELYFRETVGGANLAGTYTASNTAGGFPASRANDGNTSTQYASDGAVKLPQLLYIDLGAGNEKVINEIYNYAGASPTVSFKVATVVSSSDAVNWDVEWTIPEQANWATDEVRTFARPA